MNRSFVFGAVALLLCGVSGCKPSREQLMRDQLSAMRDVTAVLESIQDDASAQRALPKLEKAAARLAAVNEKALKSQSDPDAKKKGLEQLNDPKVQAHIREVMEAGLKMMAAQMQAVQKAPGKADQIQAAMRKAGMSG